MAVIAVDPSSPITGGALLGDRVRMQAYAEDRDVFIRSMASRGHAGGLASTSSAAAAVLDACGFDLLFIETVGTGQSEVEVAAAADTTVVLEAPEMGDEVQAIKAGLLEVADLVVVNKGDKPGAQRTAAQLRAMLVPSVGRGGGGRDAADPERPRPKRPEVLITTAATGEGVPELLAALDRHRTADRDAAGAARARLARAEAQVWAILGERLRAALVAPERRTATERLLEDVAAHRPRSVRGRRPPARRAARPARRRGSSGTPAFQSTNIGALRATSGVDRCRPMSAGPGRSPPPRRLQLRDPPMPADESRHGTYRTTRRSPPGSRPRCSAARQARVPRQTADRARRSRAITRRL